MNHKNNDYLDKDTRKSMQFPCYSDFRLLTSDF